MCVLMKDLQRSVVDVDANKGLSGKTRRGHLQVARGYPSAVLRPDLPQIFSPRSLRLCVESTFPLFPNPKKCIIMHFSRKPVPNMDHNALFEAAYPPLTTSTK